LCLNDFVSCLERGAVAPKYKNKNKKEVFFQKKQHIIEWGAAKVVLSRKELAILSKNAEMQEMDDHQQRVIGKYRKTRTWALFQKKHKPLHVRVFSMQNHPTKKRQRLFFL
jgi:hypothetical protein